MFLNTFYYCYMKCFQYFYQRMARPQPSCTLGGPRINQTQITDTSGHSFHLWTICSRFRDKYEARGTYSENGQWLVNLNCFNFWCKTEHCTAIIHMMKDQLLPKLKSLCMFCWIKRRICLGQVATTPKHPSKKNTENTDFSADQGYHHFIGKYH